MTPVPPSCPCGSPGRLRLCRICHTPLAVLQQLYLCKFKRYLFSSYTWNINYSLLFSTNMDVKHMQFYRRHRRQTPTFPISLFSHTRQHQRFPFSSFSFNTNVIPSLHFRPTPTLPLFSSYQNAKHLRCTPSLFEIHTRQTPTFHILYFNSTGPDSTEPVLPWLKHININTWSLLPHKLELKHPVQCYFTTYVSEN